jgi:hypothetical protein
MLLGYPPFSRIVYKAQDFNPGFHRCLVSCPYPPRRRRRPYSRLGIEVGLPGWKKDEWRHLTKAPLNFADFLKLGLSHAFVS